MTPNQLISDIKTLRANSKTLREFAKEKYLNKDGEAEIHLYISNDSLYDPLSNPDDRELSSDVINKLEEEAYYIPVEYPLKAVFHCNDELDMNHIQKKLSEHYWKKLADKSSDLKINNFITIISTILGLILLSVYFALQIADRNILFTELFSIAGSFSIWEAIDRGFLARNALKIDHLNIAQLALTKVIKEK